MATSAAHKDPAVQNADDLELSALRTGTAVFDQGIFDDQLSDSLEDEYPEGGGNDQATWSIQDNTSDLAVAVQMTEIQRRAHTLGDSYPFEIQDGSLVYRGNRTLCYEFCLCVSNANSIISGEYARLPRVFERMVGRVLATALGPHGDWYRTGWPPEEDRPTRFRDVVQELNQRTGEWLWGALPELDDDPGPRSVKDGGIDVVVWKHFGDKRVGQIFLLGQCACGNDWPAKVRDLDPDVLRDNWLKMLSYCKQLRFMAVPFHIRMESVWSDCCLNAGIMLDRVRLTRMAEMMKLQQFFANDSRKDFLDLIRLIVPQFEPVKRG